MSEDEFNHKLKVGSFPWEENIPESPSTNDLIRLENYVKSSGYNEEDIIVNHTPGIGYIVEFRYKPTKRQLKELKHLKLEPIDY
jgi:hypothetical protein